MSEKRTRPRPPSKMERLCLATLRSLNSAVVVVAHERGKSVIRFVNDKVHDLFGLAPDEFVGKPPAALWEKVLPGAENSAALLADLERLKGDSFETRSDLLRFRSPFPAVIERSTAPLVDEKGNLVGRIWTFGNVNREFQLRERLQKKRRMEALVRSLAGFLSHSILDDTNLRVLCRVMCNGLDAVSVFFAAAEELGGKVCQYAVAAQYLAAVPPDWLGSFLAEQARKAGQKVATLEMELAVPEHTEFFFRRGVSNWLLVPLTMDGRRYGAFLAENDARSREWQKEDLATAQYAATIAALWVRKELLLRDLADARADAQSASRARGDFIALLSHELKTPLHPLLGFTQLLEECCREMPGEARDMIKRISGGARRLKDLMDDLLTLTRLDSRLDGWRRYPCDPRGIVQDSCGWAQTAAGEKGMTIRFELSGEVAVCEADGDALRRAINAMLSNAVRFGPADSEIRVVLSGQPDGFLVQVIDHGPGVPEEQKRRIFEPFVQGEPVLTRRYGGAGIGLTLVRRVAESHHGQSWVEDAPGGGSVFSLKIPREPAA